MNMLPVLARAFGVDPVAFERQVEAYENPGRLQAAERRVAALEAENGRLREIVGAGIVVIQNAIACDLLPEGRRELLDQWILDAVALAPKANMYRRFLDDVWRQVYRYITKGEELPRPTHEESKVAAYPPGESAGEKEEQ